MKKFVLSLCCVCMALMMSSCYSSSVCVGNMRPNEPAIEVGKVHNTHLIEGLVGSPEVRAKSYVNGEESYKVKHYISFVDGLLRGVTFGIYTPSTTKFYVPLKSATGKKTSKRNSRYYDDDEDDD
ncbi:MAG: Bor protein [Bacteroidaceae bacterium]|nr:Bor protein [Bacteroidaceae bacterium]